MSVDNAVSFFCLEDDAGGVAWGRILEECVPRGTVFACAAPLVRLIHEGERHQMAGGTSAKNRRPAHIEVRVHGSARFFIEGWKSAPERIVQDEGDSVLLKWSPAQELNLSIIDKRFVDWFAASTVRPASDDCPPLEYFLFEFDAACVDYLQSAAEVIMWDGIVRPINPSILAGRREVMWSRSITSEVACSDGEELATAMSSLEAGHVVVRTTPFSPPWSRKMIMRCR